MADRRVPATPLIRPASVSSPSSKITAGKGLAGTARALVEGRRDVKQPTPRSVKQPTPRSGVDLRDERYRNDVSLIRDAKMTEGRDYIKDPNTGRTINLDKDGFEIINRNTKTNSSGIREDPRKRQQQMPASSVKKPLLGLSSQQFAAKMIGQKTPASSATKPQLRNTDPRMKMGGLAVMPKKGKR